MGGVELDQHSPPSRPPACSKSSSFKCQWRIDGAAVYFGPPPSRKGGGQDRSLCMLREKRGPLPQHRNSQWLR